jgi:undecaprenyl diphosphate synthase
LEMKTSFKGFIVEGSEEEALLGKINLKKLPRHVAVIMDGNGRWAKQRGFDRAAGHRQGAESARVVTECAARLGIKYLTMFAFSSENWKRPLREVSTLMELLYDNLVDKRELLIDNQIRLKMIGNQGKLPSKLREKIRETEEMSKDFKKMQINLALNYGSRGEIVAAVRKIMQDRVPAGRVNEKLFGKYLYTDGSPDPDLLIRTSGELRISNFLLFQIAYAELYFTEIFWPDFRVKEFFEAVIDFQQRKRRFGSL